MQNHHIVLLGDSIFDNAKYVPDGLPVIEHLRQIIPPNWQATLLAVDGDATPDVFGQTKRIQKRQRTLLSASAATMPLAALES